MSIRQDVQPRGGVQITNSREGKEPQGLRSAQSPKCNREASEVLLAFRLV